LRPRYALGAALEARVELPECEVNYLLGYLGRERISALRFAGGVRLLS
jgi:hypothetical protein